MHSTASNANPEPIDRSMTRKQYDAIRYRNHFYWSTYEHRRNPMRMPRPQPRTFDPVESQRNQRWFELRVKLLRHRYPLPERKQP